MRQIEDILPVIHVKTLPILIIQARRHSSQLTRPHDLHLPATSPPCNPKCQHQLLSHQLSWFRMLCSLVCRCSLVLIVTQKNASLRLYYRLICQHLCPYVSLKICFQGFGEGCDSLQNRHFLQVIGCVREY